MIVPGAKVTVTEFGLSPFANGGAFGRPGAPLPFEPVSAKSRPRLPNCAAACIRLRTDLPQARLALNEVDHRHFNLNMNPRKSGELGESDKKDLSDQKLRAELGVQEGFPERVAKPFAQLCAGS